MKTLKSVKDSSHPSHILFSLLSHGKRYGSAKSRILNSFHPQAIRLLKSSSNGYPDYLHCPSLYLDLYVLGSCCGIVRLLVRYCYTIGTRSTSISLLSQYHLLTMCMWPIKIWFDLKILNPPLDWNWISMTLPHFPPGTCSVNVDASLITQIL
jgi:hypothetical protein